MSRSPRCCGFGHLERPESVYVKPQSSRVHASGKRTGVGVGGHQNRDESLIDREGVADDHTKHEVRCGSAGAVTVSDGGSHKTIKP
jgi:hypothetical protein